MRSQTSSTSARRCDESRIVLPRLSRSTSRSFTCLVPIGSRPDVGSSRMRNSGSLIERLGDAEAARHALGVLAHRPMPGAAEPDHLDQLLDASLSHRTAQPEDPPVVVERLVGVEEAVHVRLLREVADPPLDRDVRGIATEHRQPAAGLAKQAENQLDRRALARAVGAEQPEDLVATDRKVDAVDGAGLRPHPEVAEDLDKPRGLDDRGLALVGGHHVARAPRGVRGDRAVRITRCRSRGSHRVRGAGPPG